MPATGRCVAAGFCEDNGDATWASLGGDVVALLVDVPDSKAEPPHALAANTKTRSLRTTETIANGRL